MKATDHVIFLLILESVCELTISDEQKLSTGISHDASMGKFTAPTSLMGIDAVHIISVTTETNSVESSDQILSTKGITIMPTESTHHKLEKQSVSQDVLFVSETEQSNYQTLSVHLKSLSSNWSSEQSTDISFATQKAEKMDSNISTLQTSLSTELETETVRRSDFLHTDYFTVESSFVELTFQKTYNWESTSLQNTILKSQETTSRQTSYDRIILSSFEYHATPECSGTDVISQITVQTEMQIVQSKTNQSRVISLNTVQSKMSKTSQPHVISQMIDQSKIQLESSLLGKVSKSDTSRFCTESEVAAKTEILFSSPSQKKNGDVFSLNTDYSHHKKVSSVSIAPTASLSVDLSEQFSSHVSITTTPLPAKYSIHFHLKFRGDCKIAITKLLPQFWETLIMVLADKLFISASNIRPDNISCHPVVVYITVFNVTVSNIAETLEKLVDRGHFVLSLLYEDRTVHYKAYFVEEVSYPNDRFDLFQAQNEQLDTVDIIIIIVSCCVCIALILIGLVIGIKECYRRKHEQSFDLLNFPHVNLNLEDFSLARIPRPQTVYADDGSKLQVIRESNRWSLRSSHQMNIEPFNVDNIHLRTKAHSDGLIVGLTYTNRGNREHHSTPTSPTHSRINEDICTMNISQENLYKQRSYLYGTTNPVYDDNIETHDII